MASSERFGNFSSTEITTRVQRTVPKNTVNTQSSIWKQFTEFCKARKYQLVATTSTEELANILKDWAFNMKKVRRTIVAKQTQEKYIYSYFVNQVNGDDYKECVVKTLWNTVAKLLQEKYYNEFHIKIDPFNDIHFKGARDARNAKRRILQEEFDKRKCSAKAVTRYEVFTMARQWSEEEPEGLQKRFYHVAAFELAWRGGEATYCKIFYFKEEKSNDGTITGRFEYNPVFTKTCQGGARKLSDSKYLASNISNNDICPVRLLKKLLEKRGDNIKSDRLFLTPNPFWKKPNSKGWYKDMPIGVNEIAKWTKQSAEKIIFDIKRQKFTLIEQRQ
jgi:hypothetical protein